MEYDAPHKHLNGSDDTYTRSIHDFVYNVTITLGELLPYFTSQETAAIYEVLLGLTGGLDKTASDLQAIDWIINRLRPYIGDNVYKLSDLVKAGDK